MTDEQLATFLRCPVDRLPLLGLCGQPRDEPGRFADDVRRIAAYAKADTGKLAQVIRSVQMDDALSRRVREDASGYAAAARDREGEPDEPPRDDATPADEGPEADGHVG